MKIIRYILAIVLLPFYFAVMLVIGLLLGAVEGADLTTDVFNEITK